MRKLMLLSLLCCFLSCSEDISNSSELNGSWTLVNVSCFCAFSDPPNFNQTEITFDDKTNELLVRNNGDEVYFQRNGTYFYSDSSDIAGLIDVNRIIFEDGISYTYIIDGDMLQLVFVDEPNIADDEVRFSFIKNP